MSTLRGAVSRRGLVKNFCAASPRDLDLLIRQCALQRSTPDASVVGSTAVAASRSTTSARDGTVGGGGGWMEAVSLLQGALHLNMVPTRQSYRAVIDLVARHSDDVCTMGSVLRAMSASNKSALALERYLLRSLANHQPVLGLELLLSSHSHAHPGGSGVRSVGRTATSERPQGALHESTWLDRSSVEMIVTRVVHQADANGGTAPSGPHTPRHRLEQLPRPHRWLRTLELLPLMEAHRVPPAPAVVDAFLCACTASHQWEVAARLVASAVKAKITVTPRMVVHLLKSFDGSSSCPWGDALRFVTTGAPTHVLQNTRVLMSMAGVLGRAGQWARALAAADRVVTQMSYLDKADGCDVLNLSIKHLPWATALRYYARAQHLATAETMEQLLMVLAASSKGAHTAATQLMRTHKVAAAVGLRSDAAVRVLGWANAIALVCDAHGHDDTSNCALRTAECSDGVDLGYELLCCLGRHAPHRLLACPSTTALMRHLSIERQRSLVDVLVAGGAWRQGIAIALQTEEESGHGALVDGLAVRGHWSVSLQLCSRQSDALEACLSERGLWSAAIAYAFQLGATTTAPLSRQDGDCTPVDDVVPTDTRDLAAPMAPTTVATLRQFAVPLCASLGVHAAVEVLLTSIGVTTNVEALLLDKSRVVREEQMLLSAATSSVVRGDSERGGNGAATPAAAWSVFEQHCARSGPLPLSLDAVAALCVLLVEQGDLDRLGQTLRYATSKGLAATRGASSATYATWQQGTDALPSSNAAAQHTFELLSTFQWARGDALWGYGAGSAVPPRAHTEVIRQLERYLSRNGTPLSTDVGRTMDHIMMVVAAAVVMPVAPHAAPYAGDAPASPTGASDLNATVLVALDVLAWLMSGDGQPSAVADAVCRCTALTSHLDGAMARLLAGCVVNCTPHGSAHTEGDAPTEGTLDVTTASELPFAPPCAVGADDRSPGTEAMVATVDFVAEWLLVHVVTARGDDRAVRALDMLSQTLALRAHRLLPGAGAFSVGAIELVLGTAAQGTHLSPLGPSATRLLHAVAAQLPHNALHLWARLLRVATEATGGTGGVPAAVLQGAAAAHAHAHMWSDALRLLQRELTGCADATRSCTIVSQIHTLQVEARKVHLDGVGSGTPWGQQRLLPCAADADESVDDAVAKLVAQSGAHWAVAVDLLLHHDGAVQPTFAPSDGVLPPVSGRPLATAPSSAVLRRVLIACIDTTHSAEVALSLMRGFHERFGFAPQPQDFSALLQTISCAVATQEGDALLRHGMLVLDAMQTKYGCVPTSDDYHVLALLCAWASDSALHQVLEAVQRSSTAAQGAHLVRVVQALFDEGRFGADGDVAGVRLQRALNSARMDSYWTPQRLGKIAEFVPQLESASTPSAQNGPEDGDADSSASAPSSPLTDVAEQLSTALFQGTVPASAIVDVWGQPAKRERLVRMHRALHHTQPRRTGDDADAVPGSVLRFAARFAPWIRYGSTKYVNECAVSQLGQRTMAEWPVHRLRTVLNVRRKDVLRLLSMWRRSSHEPDDQLWTDDAVEDLLQGSGSLLVRLGPFAQQPVSREMLEAVAATVFHHAVDVAVLERHWQTFAARAQHLQTARWPPAVEAELVAKVTAMDGGCPLVLVSQPSATAEAIADYWRTYSTALMPSTAFNTTEMRYVAMHFYVDLAAADDARAVGRANSGVTEGGPLEALCDRIAASTFALDPSKRPQQHCGAGGPADAAPTVFGYHSGQDVLQLWRKSKAVMADWYRTSTGYAVQRHDVIGAAVDAEEEVVFDTTGVALPATHWATPPTVAGVPSDPSCPIVREPSVARREAPPRYDGVGRDGAEVVRAVPTHRWQAAMALLAQSLRSASTADQDEDWRSNDAATAPRDMVPLLVAVAKTCAHDGLSTPAIRSLMDPLLVGGVPPVVWRLVEGDGELPTGRYLRPLSAHDAAVLDRVRPQLPPPIVDALASMLSAAGRGSQAAVPHPTEATVPSATPVACGWTLATLLTSLVLSKHQRTLVWDVLTECQCMPKLPQDDAAVRRALSDALWLGC